MSRFLLLSSFGLLMPALVLAQQPSGTSAAPAPGTHMDQSTVQTVGTTPNGSGATITNPRPSPDAGTALPTLHSGNSLASGSPLPVTKTIGGGGLKDPGDVADLLAPKPLNPSKLSLLGGTVKSIDQIRDHMTVQIYGGKTLGVKFDQRTHFYRDAKETTQLAVKAGDRVYLDTQLFEGKIFAKNVHVETGNSSADANGQIVGYSRKSGDMVVEDQLAGTTVRFRVSPETRIKAGESGASQASLLPGALVAVKFSESTHGIRRAEEVNIIAAPGMAFTYFGRVTHLDIRTGLMDIENRADGKIYEVHFDPQTRVPENLLIGSQVTVVATFHGTEYTAQSIKVNAGPDQALAGGSQPSTSGDQNQDEGQGNKPKNKD